MNKTLATRNEWVCSEISKGLDHPSTKSATKIQQGNPPPAPHAAATDILHELGAISQGFWRKGDLPRWILCSRSTFTPPVPVLSFHLHRLYPRPQNPDKSRVREKGFSCLTAPRMFSVLFWQRGMEPGKAGRLCAHTACILGKQGVNRKWSLAVNPQCPEPLPPGRLHLIKDLQHSLITPQLGTMCSNTRAYRRHSNHTTNLLLTRKLNRVS